MLVMVFDTEPNNPIRTGTDVEIRIMLKGMSEEEGDRLGQALNELSSTLRPERKPVSFILDVYRKDPRG